jgi:hypothetical protein
MATQIMISDTNCNTSLRDGHKTSVGRNSEILNPKYLGYDINYRHDVGGRRAELLLPTTWHLTCNEENYVKRQSRQPVKC